MIHRPDSAIAAALATVALVAGCGGGGGGGGGGGNEDARGKRPAETGNPETSGAAADYARAERAMRAADYDTALKLMAGLRGYRDARKRLAEFRVAAAHGILAQARRKLRPSPKAAVALTTTSLRYHPTQEAHRFLRRAEAAHARFKRRQQLGLEHR